MIRQPNLRGISRLNFVVVLLSPAILSAVPDNASASINVTGSRLYAHSEMPGVAGATFTGTSIPQNTALDAVQSAVEYSRNQIEWTSVGNVTTFNLDMSHGRTNGGRFLGAYAGINFRVPDWAPDEYFIDFTLTQDTQYAIEGEYEVSRGSARQAASLRSKPDNTSYFFSNQAITGSVFNHTFELGAGAFSGSLTGTLPAGDYRWSFTGSMEGGDDNATGVGFFLLRLTEPAGAVPEAASFLVWGLLGLSTIIPTSRCRLIQYRHPPLI